MAEQFLDLTSDDRREALGVAAARLRRPAHLLEKDVWVVWKLQTLFAAPFAEHLAFKGGTSLSKAFGAIRRFSEDVDLTYDIRALAPDLAGVVGEPVPSNRSQQRKWSDEISRPVAALDRTDSDALDRTATSREAPARSHSAR